SVHLFAKSVLPGFVHASSARSLRLRNAEHRCIWGHAAAEEFDERRRRCAGDRAHTAGSVGILDFGWPCRRGWRWRTRGRERDAQRIAAREFKVERVAIVAGVPKDGRAHAPFTAAELHGIVQHGYSGWCC